MTNTVCPIYETPELDTIESKLGEVTNPWD